MAFNGSGVFNLVSGNPVVTGTTISSTWANNTLSDVATGLSNCVTRDGQSPATANLPMGGYKLTGLALATATGDALSYGRAATVSALTNSALTSGRVPYASTGGLFVDSTNLTFDGTTLSAGGLATAGTLTFSGGTANGVAYLNASKQVTTGSALTFDGTNLGIGTSSPSTKLSVTGDSSNLYTGLLYLNDSTASAAGVGGRIGFAGVTGAYATVAGLKENATGGDYAGYLAFSTRPSGSGITERMRLDSSGNLGLGVTPSAWGATYKAVQLGSYGAVETNNSNKYVALASNHYNNGSGDIYIANGYATRYYQDGSGAHVWNTAPSGTAGNAISFSQVMTLDASGRLMVGSTSAFGAVTGEISVKATSGGAGVALWDSGVGAKYQLIAGATGANAFGLYDLSASAYRWVVDASGNLLVGTTSGSYKITCNGQPGANGYTAWTNYSDQRLKENIVDFNGGLAEILKLKPKSFNYNELSGYDEETRARTVSGFIAQELQLVCPEMVGTTEIDGVEYLDTNTSNLNLLLVKAIQEQQAIIETLTARITTLEAK